MPIRYDERRYRDRWRIEATFRRLKDFRRVATRYDNLATNVLATVTIAAPVAFWLHMSPDPGLRKVSRQKNPAGAGHEFGRIRVVKYTPHHLARHGGEDECTSS